MKGTGVSLRCLSPFAIASPALSLPVSAQAARHSRPPVAVLDTRWLNLSGDRSHANATSVDQFVIDFLTRLRSLSHPVNSTRVQVEPPGYDMPSPLPSTLQALLSARDQTASENAWEHFLAEFSPLLLHVARLTPGDHDSVMDKYLFMIDALRKDDCRRLRAYSEDGRGTFTTWLVAVGRRLCVDEHRTRYGRSEEVMTDARRERRRLEQLEGNDALLDSIESTFVGPESALDRLEIHTQLTTLLARLETEDRLLLKLKYEDGLPVSEIARIVAEPSQFRIYRRLDKILASIREGLAAVGIGSAE